MIKSKSALQQILAANSMNTNASGYFVNQLMPAVAQKAVGGAAGSKIINPENSNTVTAEVPTGAPLVPTAIPNGLSIEDTVSVTIDFSAATPDLTLNKVILFDEASYYQNRNGIASPFPANSVYIGSAANNLYQSWLSELCSKAFVFHGVKIDVSAVNGAAASVEQQFQELMIRHSGNTRKTTSTELEIANFQDPNAYTQFTRIIPLTGENARVDRNVAWEYHVYNGLKVKLTFFNALYARG